MSKMRVGRWLGACYCILWKHTTGRPWTYVIRDFVYENPVLMILLGMVAGIALQRWLTGENVFHFAIGFLAGHLFWGTKWRPNQHA